MNSLSKYIFEKLYIDKDIDVSETDVFKEISDVINNYLSQCVDYTLKMQIDENGDKLELNVKVIDSK